MALVFLPYLFLLPLFVAAVNINSLSSMINRYIRDTIVELDARLYDLGAAQWWLLDLGPCFIGCWARSLFYMLTLRLRNHRTSAVMPSSMDYRRRCILRVSHLSIVLDFPRLLFGAALSQGGLQLDRGNYLAPNLRECPSARSTANRRQRKVRVRAAGLQLMPKLRPLSHR
jgi:hypothetical protein